ncbi:hypothetical protein MLD52_23250, partial [Puniceicoccaceae bacterium K14]|nr:hypothetical protein [Puniceicoccaceae bacterium K14]
SSYTSPNANVSEVLIYERALGEQERVDLEASLADKYGIYHPDATWIENNYDEAFRTVVHSNSWHKSVADEFFAYRESSGLSNMFFEGLRAWFRPEELAEDYSQGDLVDVWRDAMGLRALSTASSSYRPSFESSLEHGLAGLRFDGGNDEL